MITRDGKSASKADFDTLAELNSNFIDGTVLDTSTATRPPASHTQAASTISDSTAAGRALLTAADAAAQLTALGTDAAGTARPPLAHSQAVSTISDSGSKGRQVVQAASGAAVRTTIKAGMIYDSTAAPTVNNDGVDTAALGQTFELGAVWMRTGVSPVAWFRADSVATGAAVWTQFNPGLFATAAQGSRAPSAPANPGDDAKVWTASAGSGSWTAIPVQNHESLFGLLGGGANDHQHLTTAEKATALGGTTFGYFSANLQSLPYADDAGNGTITPGAGYLSMEIAAGIDGQWAPGGRNAPLRIFNIVVEDTDFVAIVHVTRILPTGHPAGSGGLGAIAIVDPAAEENFHMANLRDEGAVHGYFSRYRGPSGVEDLWANHFQATQWLGLQRVGRTIFVIRSNGGEVATLDPWRQVEWTNAGNAVTDWAWTGKRVGVGAASFGVYPAIEFQFRNLEITFSKRIV